MRFGGASTHTREDTMDSPEVADTPQPLISRVAHSGLRGRLRRPESPDCHALRVWVRQAGVAGALGVAGCLAAGCGLIHHPPKIVDPSGGNWASDR
jgi:hypothetical protein